MQTRLPGQVGQNNMLKRRSLKQYRGKLGGTLRPELRTESVGAESRVAERKCSCLEHSVQWPRNRLQAARGDEQWDI